MDFKITVPIPQVSDALFDSEVGNTPAASAGEPGLAQDEMDKLNVEEQARYREEHPSLKEFVGGLKGQD